MNNVTVELTKIHAEEREAFVRLCEALSIEATAAAYLKGELLVTRLEVLQAELDFVLAHGLPVEREDLFRYLELSPTWYATKREALEAAMQGA